MYTHIFAPINVKYDTESGPAVVRYPFTKCHVYWSNVSPIFAVRCYA